MPRKKAKPIASGSVFRKTYKDRHGQERLTATWYATFYRDGRPHQFSTRTEDYDEAVALLRQRMATRLEPHHGELSRVRVGHILDLVEASHRYLKRKSWRDAQLRIEKHLRARLGELLVEDLTPAEVRKYVADRCREKAAPATINKELALLRRGLRLGAREVPPLVARVIHIEMLPVDNVREGVLTHEQYRAVRDLLPAYARIALVIAYHTGARKGEIVGIRREYIELEAGRILLAATKNGEARYLPVYGDMRAELEMAVAAMRPSCRWLMQETTKRGRTVRVVAFRKAWAAACKGAGIPDALFHDLRRTAVTNMIEAGVGEAEAMKVIGHKTRSMLDRYHVLSSRRLAAIGDKLGAHMAAKEAAVKAEEAKRPKGRAS